MTTEAPKHILVVDDEEDVRSYLRTALEDAGFVVETACDGLEGLEKARRNPPDLISLDLVMPKHSGAKFHRAIQKDPALARIPVLIVTGHARDDLGKADFEEMTMSGPGVYLEKPVRPATYVGAVCKMLGMESPPESQPRDLRGEIERELAGAGREALQRALDALKHG
jgi:CheY-like chemotaxis protein